MSTSQTTTPPKPQSDGFWDSLTPEDQKKYTLVFLISIGTTLLVTGRTAGSALKRSQTTSTSTTSSITPTPSIPTLISQSSIPIKKPQFLSPTPPTPAASNSRLVEAPSASFLHPNSLVGLPPNRKRLLPSFVTSPSPSLPSSPSAYFLPNSTLTQSSTAYAHELDKQDKLHEDGEEETLRLEQEKMLAEPGFNPAIYAAKALGIATVITLSSFGVAVWGIMNWLGVDDMEGLSLALSHRLQPALEAARPELPKWAKPEEKVTTIEERREEEEESEREDETMKEEMSYWREVKETLDREAEERRRDRKERWEGLRRRAGLEAGEVKRV